MSPAMAARVVIVCVLGIAMGARAQTPVTPAVVTPAPIRPIVRRPVAVIVLDLESHDGTEQLVKGINEALASHLDLAPLPPSDGAALIDAIDVDDRSRMDDATLKHKRALDALQPARRDFQSAVNEALDGQAELVHVSPWLAIVRYADLALAQGQALLAQNRQDEAREAFALAYRLDPKRVLDDVHYYPEVIQAFEAAKTARPGTGTISVKGMGTVWIDGVKAGDAGDFPVPVGRHVVWLTGPQRETLGKDVTVGAGKQVDVTIMDGNLSRRQKVQRFRAELAHASDSANRAVAMKQLAQFVGVKDAVLLSTVNGKLIWQTWVDRAPGFSAIREVGKDKPIELLSPLAPPRPTKPPEPPPVKLPPLDTTSWYEKRTYQVSIGATVLATVVGIILYARSGESPRSWGQDITFPPPSTLGRPR